MAPPSRDLTDLAEALKAEPSRVVKAPAARQSFTLRRLRRVTFWAATAAAALLAAALTSRSEIGMERIALALHRGAPQVAAAASAFDAKAETERLAEAVRGLAATNDEIKIRLAAVEHDMDDVTGSVTKQIEAVSATRRTDDGPSVAATAAVTATLGAPTVPPAAAVAALQPAASPLAPEAAAPQSQKAYGADIGSGLTIQTLRTRWITMRAAHPGLLDGLEPIVSVKELPQGNRVELRLIAGPFAQAGAAAQFCSRLEALSLFCQPIMYDGQRLNTAVRAITPAPSHAAPSKATHPTTSTMILR